jgi:hypothetical protein
MSEKVRIVNLCPPSENGYYTVTFITDDGAQNIELDRANMIRFAHELLKTAWNIE